MNRWLLFFVSKENLKRYFNAAMTLRELVFLNQKDFVYFIDIDSNVDYKNIIRKAVKDFPMKYALVKEAFFILILLLITELKNDRSRFL